MKTKEVKKVGRMTFDDFVEKVEELGFLGPFSINFVPDEQVWCGDPELDPWFWKERAAREKRLAHGSFFGGKKGYIAPRFYSIFQDAFRPRTTVEERYRDGKLGQYEWDFWKLLEKEGRPLGTHEFRSMLGVTAKNGRSALDGAVQRLQMTMDIATVGNVDMLDKNGKPYNSAVAYDIAENWIPPEWLTMNPRMEQAEALEMIYRQAEKTARDDEVMNVRSYFDKSLRLYKRFS